MLYDLTKLYVSWILLGHFFLIKFYFSSGKYNSTPVNKFMNCVICLVQGGYIMSGD